MRAFAMKIFLFDFFKGNYYVLAVKTTFYGNFS